jgi:Homeodomain-like domain
MSQTVSVIVSAKDRARLAAIIGDRSRPLKHVQRAKIVLHSADRLATAEVARRSEVSRPAVWRWQRHYAEGGVERLLREGSRKPGKPPVALSKVSEVGESPAGDGGEDGVGGFGPDEGLDPDERLGLAVGVGDEAVDGGLQLDD